LLLIKCKECELIFCLFLILNRISEVYVDNPASSEDANRIPVSITVELPNLECDFVGIDIQDDMGRHEVGFVDNTEKTPINGNTGCLFHSTFQINKVPGNFHVSTHSSHKQPKISDFSHKIKEVRFGERILKKGLPGSFNPLENVEKHVDADDIKMGMESHDYIIKVVPTVYESYNGKETVSYQYTFAQRSFIGRGTPAIWFRYDISPLTVKYKEKGEAFFSFLTAVCAVVGGVFTVANMIDGMLFSASEYYKKFELGKHS